MAVAADYAKSPLGKIKIPEFVCLLVAWTCVISPAINDVHFGMLFGVALAAWFFSIILYVFTYKGNLSAVKMNSLASMHITWAVFLFLGAGLLAYGIFLVESTGYFIVYPRFKVSAGFGVISSVLFLIDGILHYKQPTPDGNADGVATGQ